MGSLLSTLTGLFSSLLVFAWDALLTIGNIVTPALKEGQVIPPNHTGAGGKWPEYIKPTNGDSRSACPALNALANHGIFPRDGRNISFRDMNTKVREVYNFAPSFCYFVPNYAAKMLGRDYGTGKFDLADISLHNGIEHDASLTRQDIQVEPDQSQPYVPYVEELLASASGSEKGKQPILTAKDLALYAAKRRHDSMQNNPDFSLSLLHKGFGSSNSSTMLTIFGGKVDDLKSILIDERIPEGWEPRIRSRNGLTMTKFNLLALQVELGTGSALKKMAKK